MPTPTPPTPELPAKLERLGRYRIVRPLSKGGMALVYEARRESLAGVAPRVAIKLILPDYASQDAFQELFINEARLGASMHHQNLVQIQDFDRDGDRFFLVMEYVEGFTLRRVVTLCARAGMRMPGGVIAEVGRQACDGLHYAHAAKDEEGRHLGLVHRDMKPSNLILGPHGIVKVLDFGISKGRLTNEKKGAVKGTWGYMAPEQSMGQEVGPTTDLFGLAVVLYEMAAQCPLFDPQRSQDEIRQLLQDDHAARMATQLDPSFARLVPPLIRALQRDPHARYATAADFGRALSALLPDPITARDEVTRFYQTVEGFDQGRAAAPARPSEPAVSASASSMDHRSSAERRGGALAGRVALAGIVLSLATALGWLVARSWGSSVEPPVTTPTPLPADEPAGPAALVPAKAPVPPVSEIGRLTVSAEPDVLEVYVDGKLASKGALRERELGVGRHFVAIVARDGRVMRFDVEVKAGESVRRVWDFDRSQWRR